jgi:dynein assembly factor 1
MEMTPEALKQICKDLKLYSTPAVNDKLYCHYKGFNRIENLDKYTGLRCIWLEGNGFNKIEGLECCTELRTIYLQENLITTIEGLDSNLNLANLNLSQNNVKCISGLSHLKELSNLQLKSNHLRTADDVKHVLDCPSLNVLDIQHNKIDDPAVVDIFEAMPNLRVLYLQGNDVVKKIKQYRKTLISKIKGLRYLDDRPVFADERLRAEAWAAEFNASGDAEKAAEAERNEIKRQREEKAGKDKSNAAAFDQMVKDGQKRALEAKRELLAKGVDPDEDNSFNIFSGEPIVPTKEDPLLRKARNDRWARITEGEEQEGDIFSFNDVDESDDEEPTVAEQKARDKLLEDCRTIGDGTHTQAEADSKMKYEVKQAENKKAAKYNAAQRAKLAAEADANAGPPPLEGGGSLFGMLSDAREAAESDAKEMAVGWGGGGAPAVDTAQAGGSGAAGGTSPTSVSVSGGFTPCTAFAGAKTGYEFKTGGSGTGYYRKAGYVEEAEAEAGVEVIDKENSGGVVDVNSAAVAGGDADPSEVGADLRKAKADAVATAFTDMEELD